MLTRSNLCLRASVMKNINNFMNRQKSSTMQSVEDPIPKRDESERMKKFHEKLKLDPMPRVKPSERFVELVLVDTDPKTGEIITDNEKEPTKWGDWQIGGRVSDF